MSLFKSKEDRRIERAIEERKGLSAIKKNIRDLEKNENDYIQKARRAYQMGSKQQLDFLKSTIKRTASQRLALERQLLNIETALQIKNQAQAHAQFASSMSSISKSIGESFSSTDLVSTQKEFEKAMGKAESLEQQMELFLDMSSSSMLGSESSGEELISDSEIDNMIADEALATEAQDSIGENISSGLEAIRKRLSEGQSS